MRLTLYRIWPRDNDAAERTAASTQRATASTGGRPATAPACPPAGVGALDLELERTAGRDVGGRIEQVLLDP